jgi:hypothetical protein
MSTPSIDPQLRPGLTPPEKCPNGCARWDNLAADGNTRNQQEVNTKWSLGRAPLNAGNQCAQPSNDPSSSPWCYCAGTNDDSWGYCQNKDAASATCRAVPNKLNNLKSEIQSCTSKQESSQNTTLATNTIKLQKDISHLSAVAQDSLLMGDSMHGKASHVQIVEQVKERNRELKEKKETLLKDIQKQEATVERSDRDFIETKDSMPEKFNPKRLNFIEDYTIALTMIGYLFMSISIIYIYSITRPEGKMVMGIITSTIGLSVLSVFLFILFFFLA